MHVIAGLRQAAVMLLVLGLAAGAVTAVWVAVRGGAFPPTLGIVLMVLAGLVGVTGGTELSRHSTSEARAFLGAGPDREQPGAGRALTAGGVFLLVAVPLFAAGLALLSTRG